MQKKTPKLKSPKSTAGFAIAALLGGFVFLNKGITGNVILSNKYSFNIISLIGLLLVFCSAILALYTIRTIRHK